ncbi:hypothetical protein C1646_669928 [Rhizophagus diaphanus]|nr:hypothetical protein C1646_669928 [Rhizophagus diaphanus] [Rhizophagus sp. MUCL 43196]
MDELRDLRHQKALELLEESGMRDLFRKNFNSTAYKKWVEAGRPTKEDEEILAYLEYKKSKDHKNGTNSAISRSVSRVSRKRSIGTKEQTSTNDDKQTIRNMYGVYPSNNGTSKKKSPHLPSRT